MSCGGGRSRRSFGDEDAAEADAARLHHTRRLHLSQSIDDVWFLDAALDPIGGRIVADILREITDDLYAADRAEVCARLEGATPTGAEIDELTRSRAQRRADTLPTTATSTTSNLTATAAPPASPTAASSARSPTTATTAKTTPVSTAPTAPPPDDPPENRRGFRVR